MVTGHFIGPDAERVTVGELADDVVTDYKVNEQDSLDKAERSATRLKEFFGNTKAHALKGDSIKRFIAQRQTEGAANATINRDLALLKRAYNLGIEAEKIVRKPTSRNSKRTIFAAAFLSTLNLWPCAAHVLTTSSPW